MLSWLQKYQSKCGALFAKVPTLIEESVKIVWDMVTLNPPAISCLPQEFDEDLHDKHATQWEDSRGTNTLVYYNPVLFFSFNLDVAHKGEVGNMPPGSASTSKNMFIKYMYNAILSEFIFISRSYRKHHGM